MKTIVIQSQKGGSGKTMLAAHLSVEAERSGDAAWVIDTDRQATCHAALKSALAHFRCRLVMMLASKALMKQRLGSLVEAKSRNQMFNAAAVTKLP